MSLPDPPPRHPLDEALRQQLADYTEAPGPQVWAGVRRQLGRPAPAWRARWRRPLPLLLGALLLLLATVGLLRGPATLSPLARSGAVPGSGTTPTTPTPARPDAKTADSRTKPLPSRPDPPRAAPAGNRRFARPNDLTLNDQSGQLAPDSRPVAGQRAADAGRAAGLTSRVAAANRARRPRQLPGVRSVEPPLVAGIDLHKPMGIGRARRQVTVVSGQQRDPARRPDLRPSRRAAGGPATGALAAAGRPGNANETLTRLTLSNQRLAASALSLAARPMSNSITRPGATGEVTPAAEKTAGAVSDSNATLVGSRTEPASPLAPLAYRTALLSASQPADSPRLQTLAALDSVRPAARPEVSRWSVQVLTGPTLSYRRLPQPETGGAATLAHRERPAAGLGAQVQLRRILSGRWALAAGLGYQQYATRLTEYDAPGAGSLPVVGSGTGLGGGRAVTATNQPSRDTYHLLVLPVQLSYALGSAGRPWQLAALAGLEAARYLGGASTLVTPTAYSAPTFLPYSFAQRPYSNARSSPYRPWSAAGSLGLELRYQPTNPGARWQLLVQPTGRYVLSSFARPNAADYSRRPFSLGLLMGAGWRFQ